jgi:hypothetical protein
VNESTERVEGKAIGLVLDFIHRLVCLPHTRRWIKSKTSQIALYNIHHRQNPFKSICVEGKFKIFKAIGLVINCQQTEFRKGFFFNSRRTVN